MDAYNALAAMPSAADDDPLQCVTIVTSTPTAASNWLTAVIDGTSQDAPPFIIVWSYARDWLYVDAMTKCPCTVPFPEYQADCTILSQYRDSCKQFGLPPVACEASLKVGGSLGVRDVLGFTRDPLYTTLQTARSAAANAQ
jgi:hypothetical protein